MPTLIMTKFAERIDGSVRAKAMSFLEKLGEDDSLPGLHVEPMRGAADPRVRTGRVDQFWRAVMFRLDSDNEVYYVVHGIWPHDKAITIAQQLRLKINPVNGLPQFEETPVPAVASLTPATSAKPSVPPAAVPATDDEPLLARFGRTRSELIDVLGVPADVADRAMAALDEDDMTRLAAEHESTWLELILIALAAGDPVEQIVDELQLDQVAAADGTGSDAAVIESLQRPAAQSQFAFIDDQDELRRVIEGGDFDAWRIFLHPDQRKWVGLDTSGPFRLSGGAGTGKTVVAVHRAARLASANPAARVVVTTFTTNLAQGIRDMLVRLNPDIHLAETLGEPGVFVAGIDSLVASVIRLAGTAIDRAVVDVLGESRSDPTARPATDRWAQVVESQPTSLPAGLANETFLAGEYSLVVLPNRIGTEAEYSRVRRPGRGVALDRAKRSAVWAQVKAYRALGAMDGGLDYGEASAVAATYLEAESDSRVDHLLVDEGQDLTPTQFQFIRALVAEGRDDLFIAEDSHQRIYGPKVVLSRYGINIRGRSRRLTLNYRTTAQNLRWAMSVLDGGSYVDIEDQAESLGYRSARSGPEPVIRSVDGLEDELLTVVAEVRRWLGTDAEPSTIAVLVHDKWQRDRVTKRLTEAGLPAAAVDRGSASVDRVLVMTRHRAKGSEFSKVIMADVGYVSDAERSRLDAMEPTERADSELRQRSLDYVAATRARDELVVLRRT